MKIEVITISEGQPRPYADSRYDYLIKFQGINEEQLELFCSTILFKAKKSSEERDWFESYYSFAYNKEKGEARYTVVSPFLD